MINFKLRKIENSKERFFKSSAYRIMRKLKLILIRSIQPLLCYKNIFICSSSLCLFAYLWGSKQIEYYILAPWNKLRCERAWYLHKYSDVSFINSFLFALTINHKVIATILSKQREFIDSETWKVVHMLKTKLRKFSFLQIKEMSHSKILNVKNVEVCL